MAIRTFSYLKGSSWTWCITVDIAIFKGSSDISWRRYYTKIMAPLLKSRYYLTDARASYRSHPPDLSRFSQLVISRGKSADGEEQGRDMERYYSVSLAAFDLYKQVDLGLQFLDVYRRVRPIVPAVASSNAGGPKQKIMVSRNPVNANFRFAGATRRNRSPVSS
jgi:hypothetical protein